uniref:Odorant receptor n=1 Tax=Brugia timori TaxID=42155 RepID=A0A0R3RC13_9BILA
CASNTTISSVLKKISLIFYFNCSTIKILTDDTFDMIRIPAMI